MIKYKYFSYNHFSKSRYRNFKVPSEVASCPFPSYTLTPLPQITTILTLPTSRFANKGNFRRAQFYKDKKKENDESNQILEAENHMDELDITWKSRIYWQAKEN